MASAESNHVPNLDHFDHGVNLNQGARGGEGNSRSGRILSDFVRAERAGIVTTAGGTDEVVTFTVPFDTDNVNVQLTSDLAASNPTVKDGLAPTKAGFTFTVAAGAAEIHWVARDMGPTE